MLSFFIFVLVRTVKFIARKNWIIVGSDDLVIRVFNYNTLERVGQFTAHSDYIRGFAVHPTRSLVLSCSDDLSIKAWDWEKAWKCVSVFEGHSHYVMAIALNPKDSNTFASVSLDKTIKVHGGPLANFKKLILFLFLDLEFECMFRCFQLFFCGSCECKSKLYDGRGRP